MSGDDDWVVNLLKGTAYEESGERMYRRPIRRLQAFLDENYVIEDHILVKVYSVSERHERVVRCMELVRVAYEAKVPVQRVLVEPKRLEVHGVTRTVAVLEYVAGQPLCSVMKQDGDLLKEATFGLIRSAGSTLARLHRATAGWVAAASGPWLAEAADPINEWWLVNGGAVLQDTAATTALSSFCSQEIADSVRRELALVWTRVQSFWNLLPAGVIHGDAHDENMIVAVSGDRISALIDWGDTTFAPFVCDIATTAAYLAVEHRSQWLAIFETVRAGYEEERVLSAEESAAIPWLYRLRLLTATLLMAKRVQATSDVDRELGFDRRLLEYLESDLAALKECSIDLTQTTTIL